MAVGPEPTQDDTGAVGGQTVKERSQGTRDPKTFEMSVNKFDEQSFSNTKPKGPVRTRLDEVASWFNRNEKTR